MAAVVRTHIRKGDRDNISMVAAETEIESGETGTNRTGGQTETMDSGEETGLVAEEMGIQPT